MPFMGEESCFGVFDLTDNTSARSGNNYVHRGVSRQLSTVLLVIQTHTREHTHLRILTHALQQVLVCIV